MFSYITKTAKNIRFNSSLKEKTSSKLYYALEELTGGSRKIFLKNYQIFSNSGIGI